MGNIMDLLHNNDISRESREKTTVTSCYLVGVRYIENYNGRDVMNYKTEDFVYNDYESLTVRFLYIEASRNLCYHSRFLICQYCNLHRKFIIFKNNA